MNTSYKNTQIYELEEWKFRIRFPKQNLADSRVILLLHGHLGNENVMWTFAKTIPDSYIVIAPRAPIQLGEGQYSWHNIQPQWPKISYYKQVTEQLIKHIEILLKAQHFVTCPFDVMGFSQGAVLAYTLALLYPDRVRKTAGLSGFIPHFWQKTHYDLHPSKNQFFIAHGTRDEIVPISSARRTAKWLRTLGACVTFCESNTGHKIGLNCIQGLEKFFRSQN